MDKETYKKVFNIDIDGFMDDKTQDRLWNIEEAVDYYESRTCGSCRVMKCTILNAIADTGKFRLVDFGCNLWKEL